MSQKATKLYLSDRKFKTKAIYLPEVEVMIVLSYRHSLKNHKSLEDYLCKENFDHLE